MELFSIEFTQITNMIRLDRDSGRIYVPDLARFFNEQYGFNYIPANDSTIDQTSMEFRTGKFEDHQIDKLSIFNDGFLVNSRVNTNILQAFVDEAVAAVKARFSLVERGIDEPQTVYDSHILVRGEFAIASKLSQLGVLTGEKINSCLERYGVSQEYEISGFMMQSDPGIPQKLRTSRFSIDRRINVPFEKNLYFSEAPLRTDDHLDLIRLLGESLS